jgi:hypothetical protein
MAGTILAGRKVGMENAIGREKKNRKKMKKNLAADVMCGNVTPSTARRGERGTTHPNLTGHAEKSNT